jgi:hypothetical protein
VGGLVEANVKVELVTQGQNWGGDLPFYFNLSQPVGKRQPNAPADVGFVQFCFAALAKSSGIIDAANVPTYARVQVTRTMDAPTQHAIDTFLTSRRQSGFKLATADGIIHAVPRGVTTSYAKETPYAIVALNFLLLHANASIWPRLDMSPLAGPVAGDIRAAMSSAVTA